LLAGLEYVACWLSGAHLTCFWSYGDKK